MSKYGRLVIFDYGMFTSIAEYLARSKEFEEVIYYCPWKRDFPTSDDYLIGSGLEGVTKAPDFFALLKTLDKAKDTIMFTDIYDGDLQEYLRSQGYAVWGTGHSEELEIDRYKTRVKFSELGLPVPETYYIKGVEALREFLQDKDHEDMYVKLSQFRGDMETWHHVNCMQSMPRLNRLAINLGMMQGELAEFLVERPIEAVEYGYDGYVCDGKFPSIATWGWEVKDVCYIGRVTETSKMPWQINALNEKMADLFKGARGDYSNEIRGDKEETPYLLDPTPRKPSPPSQCLQNAYSNWPEIIFNVARGKCVDPKPAAKFIAEAMIYSDFGKTNPNHVCFDKKYKDNIKLRNHCVINGETWVVPRMIPSEIAGAIVGTGDTLQEALDMIEEIAKTVSCADIDVRVKDLDRALETVELAKEFGILFPVK